MHRPRHGCQVARVLGLLGWRLLSQGRFEVSLAKPLGLPCQLLHPACHHAQLEDEETRHII